MENSVELENSPQMPILSVYTDYRTFLKDFYLFKRKTESTPLRPYSYANFSASADIKSPNYLKLIIEGKRNLSEQMIVRFARALRFSKEETEELKALVFYNQAVEPLERNRFLRTLSEIRARRDLASGKIDSKAWNKAPTWVSWVLYAMLDQEHVILEPERIQKLFRSRVSLEQVKVALETLVEAKHIVKNPKTGAWEKNKNPSEAPEEVPVELVRKLQSELIYLGLESLFKDSPKEREFGAFTLALTKEEFERVRFELRKVRKAIQKDVMTLREQSPGERVYQLNIQLFPLSDQET
jgi:uncharacterized protein (TIGR02147 family)